MKKITIEVEIGHDHRLVNALPPEVPIGRVRLVIEPVEPESNAEGLTNASHTNPAREAMHSRMQSAGILSTAHRAPEGTQELSPAERERVWKLFSQGRPSQDLINEDRGDY